MFESPDHKVQNESAKRKKSTAQYTQARRQNGKIREQLEAMASHATWECANNGIRFTRQDAAAI